MAVLLEKLTEVQYSSERHRVQDLTLSIEQAQTFDNRQQMPYGEREKPLAGALWSSLSFTQQLAGSGAAGTAPYFDGLMQACGLKETNVVSTSHTYTVEDQGIEDDFTTLDIDVFPGDTDAVAVDNVAGNLVMTFTPNNPALMAFAFQGIYTTPAAATTASATLTSDANPLICKGMTCTIGGTSPVVRSVSIDLQNEIASPRLDIAATNGIQDPILVDTHPVITAVIEDPGTGAKAWMDQYTAGTKTTWAIVLGSSAGNICTISCDTYLNAFPVRGVDNGIITLSLSSEMSWLDADTKLTIAFT